MKLDPRAGSKELAGPLRAAGLPIEVELLPSGDVEIEGCGPGGRPLMVGVEVKKIPDVLACVRDGRFADQLRGMRKRYEVCWLLIEGEWRLDGTTLEVRERRTWEARGGHSYQEVAAWVLTMVQRAGVLTWRTAGEAETVAWLRTLYWWWVSKEYEEHRAHLDWYTPLGSDNPFEAPVPVQQVAVTFPGVRHTIARDAARVFPSVRAMVAADEKAWQGVDGVGKEKAKKLVGWLEGRTR